jgi:hypothetical protein
MLYSASDEKKKVASFERSVQIPGNSRQAESYETGFGQDTARNYLVALIFVGNSTDYIRPLCKRPIAKIPHPNKSIKTLRHKIYARNREQ